MSNLIPSEVYEQHAVILGKTGAGKSATIRYMIESLLDAKKRVCVIDPKGDHYGIKLGADGKSPGYPVMLLGDFKNASASDLRINERSGREIGELIATGNRPAVIGFRGWMPSAMNKFWVDFASTLFNNNSSPLHLAIDEIHNFAPKGRILDPQIGVCLHWTNRLGSEGRGIGLRIIMASQRPQKVHNDLLTAAETLIAMRVTHPAAREAIAEWVKEYGNSNERGKAVMDSLALMKTGEAFVWSPEAGFFERIKFPLFKTFDSFAAPQEGKQQVLKGWAEVSLDEVKEKLAKLIEESKANDPAELKAKIRQQEAEIKNLLRKRTEGQTNAEIEKLRREYESKLRDALGDEEKRRQAQVTVNRKLHGFIEKAVAILEQDVMEVLGKMYEVLQLPAGAEVLKAEMDIRFGKKESADVPRTQKPRTSEQPAEQTADASAVEDPTKKLGRCERMILGFLTAFFHKTWTKEQIGIMTGYSPTSGGFGNALGALRSAGYIEGPGSQLKSTLSYTGQLPTEFSYEQGVSLMGKCEREIIAVLLREPEAEFTLEELAIKTESRYSWTSGGFGNALGHLNTLGWRKAVRGKVALSDDVKELISL